jgi:hypothetical protein
LLPVQPLEHHRDPDAVVPLENNPLAPLAIEQAVVIETNGPSVLPVRVPRDDTCPSRNLTEWSLVSFSSPLELRKERPYVLERQIGLLESGEVPTPRDRTKPGESQRSYFFFLSTRISLF